MTFEFDIVPLDEVELPELVDCSDDAELVCILIADKMDEADVSDISEYDSDDMTGPRCECGRESVELFGPNRTRFERRQ
jgi:hypothetical protein